MTSCMRYLLVGVVLLSAGCVGRDSDSSAEPAMPQQLFLEREPFSTRWNGVLPTFAFELPLSASASADMAAGMKLETAEGRALGAEAMGEILGSGEARTFRIKAKEAVTGWARVSFDRLPTTNFSHPLPKDARGRHSFWFNNGEAKSLVAAERCDKGAEPLITVYLSEAVVGNAPETLGLTIEAAGKPCVRDSNDQLGGTGNPVVSGYSYECGVSFDTAITIKLAPPLGKQAILTTVDGATSREWLLDLANGEPIQGVCRRWYFIPR